jgi:selenide,water dikinase
VASKSGVAIEIEASRVPLLQGASNYVALDQLPGGLHRNRMFYSSEGVEIDPEIDANLGSLLYDPQTSGGLLFSVAAESGDWMQRAFDDSGLPLWEIGSVKPGGGVHVRR